MNKLNNIESPYEINENSEARYYHGWINRIFRIYFYFQDGLNQVGSLKTIAYFLIGFGLIFKVDQANYLLLGTIGLIATPLITLLGYIMIMRGNRSWGYFTTKHASTYSKYGIELTERNIAQNDEIIQLLEDLKERLQKRNAK